MYRYKKKIFWALAMSLLCGTPALAVTTNSQSSFPSEQDSTLQVQSVELLNPTTVQVRYTNKQSLLMDFYGENIFRLFQDNKSSVVRDPKASPAAQILVDNPRAGVKDLKISLEEGGWHVKTQSVTIEINKQTSLLRVYDNKRKELVLQTTAPIEFDNENVTVTLKEDPKEYFFGGGVQNGRFSHKGRTIAIENTNSWTDGGVASPTPFYWSTKGYGVMWYTFKKGKYDFGNTQRGQVRLTHDGTYLDLFIMVSETPVGILNDFYQLTGNPVLLPKFGFYQGHLNAYNRDYWKQDDKGILFEDGKRYKESQKQTDGTKESLNGEKNNYQFSARAVIDRYANHDMPLGWILPNDGYGAGYGQDSTLDGNIENLRKLGDYARQKGVAIGLWTQSDLHPKEGIEPLLQRDIVKEVRDAGVRVLKTDVAWVGAGYSFGLNGVADVAHIMPYYGNNARPFIISLDGWAGTQRYAGIWSGDQTGGQWEYIRFHIPTYIGSGLSGQPNITSDVDGIFGGKNFKVNTRDFQWKTFTPMELNMDGWGSNEKYPHALGEPVTSINRFYLKWKSELMPYAYSIAHEAVDGKPMIRAMMLDYPNRYTLGTSTQYQFLYGPSILVAPIYQETKADTLGNDIRNGIYLPEGNWIDYFTGNRYAGNIVLNDFAAPIWKTPVFIKAGAIIPVTNPNNNVSEINREHRIYELYPSGHSSFVEYDDDGTTQRYKDNQGTTTLIESTLNKKGHLLILVHRAKGDFEGFKKEKKTEFRVNVTSRPKKINASVGKKKIKLKEVKNLDAFHSGENVFFYQERPNLNKFATNGSQFSSQEIVKNPLVLVKTQSADISKAEVKLEIEGFIYSPEDPFKVSTGELNAPAEAKVTEENRSAYTLTPSWAKVANADYYEIEFDSLIYSYIKDTSLLFEGLTAERDYSFKLRAVNKDGISDWVTLNAKTKSDPLEFAIRGITGNITARNQGGQGANNLFDFDEGNMWHTHWDDKAVPFDLIIDLNSFNTIDKFQYLPRSGKGNGTLLEGTVSYSSDKESWSVAEEFNWANEDTKKEFSFKERPNVRYIKISVKKAVGNFGSGREIYVFRVPGTESYRPGDINNDRLIDMNDFTSYINYTGLRKGDADFEGYVSNGDINKNGLIDAYDISVVATRLKGGVEESHGTDLTGKLTLTTAKTSYAKGETIEISMNAEGLKDVNAFSFALPYNAQDFEYLGIIGKNTGKMENLTNDRLHSNGQKALYPTFINTGNKEALNAKDGTVLLIKFKAKRNVKFDLHVIDGMLVDKNLHSMKF